MRVITGRARGTPLQTPPGLGTRPTVERVKEAVFSSLFDIVPGSRVLDLYAGSGQLGIEALSRGARQAVFVDSGREAAAILVENLKKTKLIDQATVRITEAETFLRADKALYDLVFLDPPYGQGLANRALSLLTERRLLSDEAVVVCESDDVDAVGEAFGDFTLTKQAKYGRVRIRYYRKSR